MKENITLSTWEEYDEVNPILAEVGYEPDTTGWRPFDTAMAYANVGNEIIVINKERDVGKCMILSGSFMSNIENPTHWIPNPEYPKN